MLKRWGTVKWINSDPFNRYMCVTVLNWLSLPVAFRIPHQWETYFSDRVIRICMQCILSTDTDIYPYLYIAVAVVHMHIYIANAVLHTVLCYILSNHNGTQLYSLAPGICGSNFVSVIFKLLLQIDILSISFKIAQRWMPLNFTTD